MSMWQKIKTQITENSSRGFFHLLSANVLIQAVAFASQLFVAGILSPDDVGRIKVIMTFLSVFSVIGGMGFNGSTLKLCSENRSQGEVRQIFSAGVLFTVISTIAFYLLALLLNSFGLFSADKMIQWLIPMGLFPVITNSVFMVLVGYFQAIKEIKLMSRITIINKLISIVAIVLLTWWLGIKGYYFAYNISFIIMLAVGLRILKSDFNFSQNNLRANFKTHWAFSKPSLLANLMSEISAYADIFVINYLLSDMQEIGFYSFALTLTVALRIFPATVQQMAIPYFSGFSSDRQQFIAVFRKYNRQLYMVVFATLIIAILVAPFLIKTIFSGKFDASIPFFMFLSIGWSIRLLTQLQSAAIFGLGKLHYNGWISLISMIFNVIIYYIFVTYFGAIGAAWASIPAGILILITSRMFMNRALRALNTR